jgi:tetratricopeptide (TPR) repeat protein
MADCTNERFKGMLHSYELGLLPEETKREFELHLYECEYCFNSLRQFTDEATLIKHDPDIRKIVHQAAAKRLHPSGEESPVEAPPTPPKRIWTSLVPSSLVAVAVLVILILRPWQIEFRPTQEAIAAENRLAIMYFDNLTDRDDPDRLGEIVTSLLITDLSESHYVRVVSSQRLHDLLNLLDMPDTKTLNSNAATQVAVRAGANWMLMGNIIEEEHRATLTAQLIEVATGVVVASQEVIGQTGDDLFTLVDRLTVEIKLDLSLPTEALEEPDPLVADATTHSPEAYRFYLEGLDYAAKFYFAEATASFREALEFDSTFAMAWFRLAMQSAGPERRELINRAANNCDQVSNREKLYIMSQQAFTAGDDTLYSQYLSEIVRRYPDEKEAHYLLGLYEYTQFEQVKTIEHMNRAIELDPVYKEAYNHLMYAYNDVGDFANAIRSINQYIELAPDEANPYDSRGDLYAYNGDLERAIESYRQALEIKPDYMVSLLKLGHMLVFNRQYAMADSCYQASLAAEDKHFRSLARLYRVYIPVHQGKLDLALQMLEDGLAAEIKEQAAGAVDGDESEFRYLRALIFAQQGEYARAADEAAAAIEAYNRAYPDSKTAYRCLYATVLAEGGDFDRAGQILAELSQNLTESGSGPFRYYYGLGAKELHRGDLGAAAAALEKASTYTTVTRDFSGHYLLGRVYLQSGRISEAVRELEQQLSIYTPERIFRGISSIKLHYYLGRAYEESRWYDKAAEQYETFLDIWSEADPGITEIDDARTRLAKLRNRS